jgi:hypothetical protein
LPHAARLASVLFALWKEGTKLVDDLPTHKACLKRAGQGPQTIYLHLVSCCNIHDTELIKWRSWSDFNCGGGRGAACLAGQAALGAGAAAAAHPNARVPVGGFPPNKAVIQNAK